MGFVERLKQDLALTAWRAEQQAAQEQAAREAQEKSRLQAEAIEQERIAKGRKLADGFRLESGIGEAVAKLGKFLASPIHQVRFMKSTTLLPRGYSRGQIYDEGSSCVFDEVNWDEKLTGTTPSKTGDGHNEYFSAKKIRIQTDPEGAIRFIAGWLGSSTIRLEKWRCSEREEILDRALSKAFKHPSTVDYSVWRDSGDIGKGGAG